jgi:hypothetical protein
MGSSEKYWQYARDCAKWAKDADNKDDQEILQRMSRAWVHLARAESDVSHEISHDPDWQARTSKTLVAELRSNEDTDAR